MLWNNSNNVKSDNNKNNILSKYNIHPFAGLWSGIGELLTSPGQYYVQANWRGNGIANTGLGYLADPSYRDPFSAGRALARLSELAGNKNKNQEGQLVRPMYDLKGNLYNEPFAGYNEGGLFTTGGVKGGTPFTTNFAPLEINKPDWLK